MDRVDAVPADRAGRQSTPASGTLAVGGVVMAPVADKQLERIAADGDSQVGLRPEEVRDAVALGVNALQRHGQVLGAACEPERDFHRALDGPLDSAVIGTSEGSTQVLVHDSVEPSPARLGNVDVEDVFSRATHVVGSPQRAGGHRHSPNQSLPSPT